MPSTRRDPNWPLPPSPTDPAYVELLAEIEEGEESRAEELFRQACLNDFWFFCRHCLTLGDVLCEDPYSPHFGKPWLDHPWLFDRCRELQADPDGFLDLWPRYFFKTALVTQSLTLWDFCASPDLRAAIITYKLDTTGEGFLGQIKRECEINEKLKGHFRDVFFENPLSESPTWTSNALTFRRAKNPKEPSLMVFGLTNNMPTSFHFDILVWDDIVTERSITSRDTIESTNQAWRNAAGLEADNTRDRMVGTHWAPNDTYQFILDLGAVKLRHRDVYDEKGEVVLRSPEWLDRIKLKMGPFNFAAQMRNQPVLGSAQSFDLSWLRYYDEDPEEIAKRLNTYILVDTARVTKDSSDYSVLAVVGLGAGHPVGNFFLLDLVRDRLSLVKTTDILFELVERWKPLCVYVEQFAAQRDVEHIRHEQVQRGYSFRVQEVSERIRKEERIRRLQHIFAAGRFYAPKEPIWGYCDGRRVDMVHLLKMDELNDWTPEGGSRHDDMLDALAWIASPVLSKKLKFPESHKPPPPPDVYRDARRRAVTEGASQWVL